MKGSTLMMAFILLMMAIFVVPQGTAQYSGDQTEDIGLHVTEIRFSDDSPNECSTITVSAVLRNDAPVLMENITMLWQMDGSEVGRVRGIALAANTSQAFELKWETEGGTYNFSAIILININGTPVAVSMLTREIPILALLVIVASVFIVALGPSVWKSIRSNGIPVKAPPRKVRASLVRRKR